MSAYFTTEGEVRGCCGHKHRSYFTAVACVKADQRGCGLQGGYSDRRVVLIKDGERYQVEWPDWA